MFHDKYVRKLILEHFGSNVTYSANTKISLFSFKDAVNDILTDKWYSDRKESAEDEKTRILKAAAQILRDDIQLKVYDMTEYPSFDEMEGNCLDLVPLSLRNFTEYLTERKRRSDESQSKLQKKQMFLNEMIVSMCRPRSFISPMQLGLSVYFHRKFGSKHIIDVLNHLGTSN